MASNLLTHLPIASTHRASIAFFLLIITIFAVPFFALSTTSDLIPSADTLPSIAHTLWDSLLEILTSSPFFFLLLNFLIAALVFLSGILDPSSADRESDQLHDEDLRLHNYPTPAQIMPERLAFDELYESQASSLPYLNMIESSLTYIAGDAAIVSNGFEIEDETRIGTDEQISSLLSEKPAFSDAGRDCDSVESSSSSSRAHATDEFFLAAGGMVRDVVHTEQSSPVTSMILKKEIVPAQEVSQAIQAKEIIQACESKDSHLEHDVTADTHTLEHVADVIQPDNSIKGEGSSDVMHDESGGDHNDDDKHARIDQECNGMEAEGVISEAERRRKQRPRIARTPSVPVTQRHRIARTPSESTIAGSAQHDMGRCMSLGSGECLGVEEQKQEEEMMSLSREELNERANAFITAFRKKLVSTAAANDNTSGQM